MRCTGAVALCVMAYWNKELVRRLNSLKIVFNVYKAYVDDVTFLTDELEKGTRIKNNSLGVQKEMEEMDKNKNGEEITVGIVEEVAESILEMIKVKMWINHDEGGES